MLTFINVWILVALGVFDWADCAPTGRFMPLDGRDVEIWVCEVQPEPAKEPRQREQRKAKTKSVTPTRAR